MQGDAVVIATDAPTAAALTGLEAPTEGMSAACVYFASTEKLYDGPALLLNANSDAFVNHAVADQQSLRRLRAQGTASALRHRAWRARDERRRSGGALP